MNTRIMVIIVGLNMLTGCGACDDKDFEDDVTAERPDVGSSFLNISITGSELAGEALSINPNINGGEFSVSWDAESSDPYHISLYASDDEIASSDDVNFFGLDCGTSSVDYQCDGQGGLSCSFTTDNKLSCGDITTFNPQRDLNGWLDGLPKQAYLILRVCTEQYKHCVTAPVDVVFQ